jgi:multimeric flavodoxin WrbA
MFALAVNGSPNPGGNTGDMLNLTLEPLRQAGWEVKLIQLAGFELRPCTGCWECAENKDKNCILPADGFDEIMTEMIKADAIILGSPTYFANASAKMKILIERAGFVAMHGGLFRGKIGAAVAVARRTGAIATLEAINPCFLWPA